MLSYNKIYMNGKSLKIPVQIQGQIWGSSFWRALGSTTVISYFFSTLWTWISSALAKRIFLTIWCVVFGADRNPRNPKFVGRQCKWFSVAQELGQWIDLKCRLGTQTRRFFRKCVSVPCGASVQSKKSPRRYSNLGLWTFGPARCPLGYLGTDYNGSDCFPTRWLLSGPDLIFLHGYWRSHVQAAGWWSFERLRTCVPGLRECVSADLMIFSFFFYYAGRVPWWMCGALSPFNELPINA